MRHASLTALALVLALLPATARAQSIPSPFRFLETTHAAGPYVGYLITDPGSLDLGPRSGPIFGGRYNIHFTGPLSGEIALGFSPTERTLYNRAEAGSENPLTPLGDVNALLMMGEAGMRFYFTGARAWRGIAPFAAATAGIIADLTRSASSEGLIPEDQRFRLGPSFAASVALGTDFYLTERLSLRAEVRDHVWRLTYRAGLTASGQRENEWANNFALTFGGAIHF